MYPNGTAQNNDNILSISLNGYVDGSAVKSEALGLLTNNKSCKGFILLSLTDEYSDNSTHKSHMVNIAKSIRIKPLSNDPSWSQKLNGQELIYRDSYSPIHLHQMVVSMLVRAQAAPKNMLFLQ